MEIGESIAFNCEFVAFMMNVQIQGKDKTYPGHKLIYTCKGETREQNFHQNSGKFPPQSTLIADAQTMAPGQKFWLQKTKNDRGFTDITDYGQGEVPPEVRQATSKPQGGQSGPAGGGESVKQTALKVAAQLAVEANRTGSDAQSLVSFVTGLADEIASYLRGSPSVQEQVVAQAQAAPVQTAGVAAPVGDGVSYTNAPAPVVNQPVNSGNLQQEF